MKSIPVLAAVVLTSIAAWAPAVNAEAVATPTGCNAYDWKLDYAFSIDCHWECSIDSSAIAVAVGSNGGNVVSGFAECGDLDTDCGGIAACAWGRTGSNDGPSLGLCGASIWSSSPVNLLWMSCIAGPRPTASDLASDVSGLQYGFKPVPSKTEFLGMQAGDLFCMPGETGTFSCLTIGDDSLTFLRPGGSREAWLVTCSSGVCTSGQL